MQHNPGLLRLDGVQRVPAGEPPAELDHTLGQTDLSQSFVALILGDILGGLPLRPVALTALLLSLLGLGVDRGVVDDLVVEGLVRVAQAGVEYGQEADLGRYYCCGCSTRRRGRHLEK